MSKSIAQNISLVSASDWLAIRADRRAEVANGGVLATAYSLMRRAVSCPKGSVITIMSSRLDGAELAELANFVARRDVTVISIASFEGLTSEADALRSASIEALVAGRLDLAQRYGRLLQAIETVEDARRDVALSLYFHARVALEECQGEAVERVMRRGAVIVHGKAAGLTDEQIEDDIAAIMEARAAKIAA